MIRLFVDFKGNMEMVHSYQCEEELAWEFVKILDIILLDNYREELLKKNVDKKKWLLNKRIQLLRRMGKLLPEENEYYTTEESHELKYIWEDDGKGHKVPKYPRWYKKSILE